MTDRKLTCFITVLLTAGLGGIIAQTVLLRELLILFSGNEFSIGVIIGSWIIWEAIGSLIGGRWSTKNNISVLILSVILFSIFFPAGIYLTRIFKVIAHIPPGVGVGLLPIFYSSALILLPSGFLHGYFFTIGCVVYDQMTGEGASSTGKVYFYEMAGTIVGGILTNYLLITHFNSFQIAAGVALISALACLALAASTGHSGKQIITALTAVLFVASSVFLTAGGAEWINRLALKEQWPGQKVVYYGNSHYQNIVVIQNENQYTFVSNGIPAVTTPVPDIAYVEEFVHFPMLAHSSPENILVLSGGAGGVINEILKYPHIKRIDYVEVDPMLLTVIKRFSTPMTKSELENHLVKLHYLDGRVFLKKTDSRYDVILLGLPSPYTLQANRFFTMEFFEAAKARLRQNGILVLTVTGSLAYYSKELKELNVSIIRTLEKVFPYSYVLPGDFNLLMASDSKEITRISPELLYGRLKDYGIRTELLTLPHLKFRLEESWRNWFFSGIRGTKASINTDLSPKGLFYHVTYLNLLFSPYLKTFFDYTGRISLSISILLITAIFVVFYLFQRRRSNTKIVYAIATTGFMAMNLELILIFVYQVYYGYVFHEIGILITAFMAGIALGSLAVVFFSKRIEKTSAAFICMEAVAALFCLVLLLLFLLVEPAAHASPLFTRIMFFFLLFFSGLLTGIEFPLANNIYQAANIGRTAGLLNSADLIGSWAGSILSGMVMLPVLGLTNGCIVLMTLKISSFLLLLTSHKK